MPPDKMAVRWGAVAFVLALSAPYLIHAQSTEKQLAFDVASIKLKPQEVATTEAVRSNIPLGPGDVYVPTGGFFSATNQLVTNYIAFAYKMTPGQMQPIMESLPDWATRDRFDIQARAEGNPTKDQMRMMMRSLLADRFKLVLRKETRQISMYALVQVKAGENGPQLARHPADAVCSASTSAVPGAGGVTIATIEGGLPEVCGGLFSMSPSKAGRRHWGARNVSMGLIASSFSSIGDVGRPVVDQTGLTGMFDFSLEFVPDLGPPPAPTSGGTDGIVVATYSVSAAAGGPSFQDALKTQLGLKLESKKGPVEVMLVEHVDHPTAN
jgi:uncharacterized protein (TIGR03435 family)